MPKQVSPSIRETAFNCPHCGTLTTQHWHTTNISQIENNSTPSIWTLADLETFDFERFPVDGRRSLRESIRKLAAGSTYTEYEQNNNVPRLLNVHVAKCYNCHQISIWVHDRMVWPVSGSAPEPNPDMPHEVRLIYDEASAILSLSPRGATALLRLAVQLLVIHLGQPGRNLDSDIANLVKRGLDERVQIALDVVRIVGNNAVHPGQLELADNYDIAEKLFGLINLITEIMISQPKHLSSMFDRLPEGARTAVERRDGKTPQIPAPNEKT